MRWYPITDFPPFVVFLGRDPAPTRARLYAVYPTHFPALYTDAMLRRRAARGAEVPGWWLEWQGRRAA